MKGNPAIVLVFYLFFSCSFGGKQPQQQADSFSDLEQVLPDSEEKDSMVNFASTSFLYDKTAPYDSIYSGKDTINILSVSAHSPTFAGATSGISFSFSFDFKRDTSFHGFESNYSMRLEFFEGKKKVKAVISTVYFRNESGHVKADYSVSTLKTGEAFVPFYAFLLLPGKHDLSVKISAFYTDSRTPGAYVVPVTGEPEKKISFDKPQTFTVQFLVEQCRFHDYDSKGKAWDWPQGMPDPIFKIESECANMFDVRYTSSRFKNSYTAGWENYSDVIVFSEKDLPALSFYDNDPFIDDLAGLQKFSKSEWFKISDENKTLKIGLADSVRIKIKI